MITLEERIGYHFQDAKILKTALTHSSYINEHALKKTDCNERLEFFGDAILEMVSSEFLIGKFPNDMEGDLSKKRAALVCEGGLANSAREISLGDYLYLGKGMEKEGGRFTDNILSDAFEALLGALFLDGGLEEAKRIIYEHVLNNIDEKIIFNDAKTTLQEMVQEKRFHVYYELLSENGPDHEKVFEIQCRLNEISAARGTGKNKKQAEQNAASETIKLIRNREICI